jgi:hypothetical protein
MRKAMAFLVITGVGGAVACSSPHPGPYGCDPFGNCGYGAGYGTGTGTTGTGATGTTGTGTTGTGTTGTGTTGTGTTGTGATQYPQCSSFASSYCACLQMEGQGSSTCIQDSTSLCNDAYSADSQYYDCIGSHAPCDTSSCVP